MMGVMAQFVVVRQDALIDLAELAREAARQLQDREGVSALADALIGSAAAALADVGLPCST